jgi:VWFA-related protein
MRQLAKVSFRYGLVLWLGALVVGSASSQTQAPPLSKDQIRVITNEVIVPVTVTNASREFVLDLAQKDFQVFDDGAAQEIDHWDLGGDPLAVVLLIDTSTRLHAFEPVIHRMGSIFTETVMALDGEAAVITYDSTVDVRQSFTQDHDAVQKAIAEAKFEAPEMNLYDAMAASVSLLKAEPTTRRRILLILGESQDSGSTAKLGQIVRSTQTSRSMLSGRAASPLTFEAPTTE